MLSKSRKSRSDRIIVISVPAVILLLAFFVLQPTQDISALVRYSSSLPFPSFSISSLLSIDRVANASNDHNMISSSSYMKNASNGEGSLTIVTISNNGSFLPNATYSISAYPASSKIANFTIKDDGPDDTNKVTGGIISVPRLHYGSYLVTELKAPPGYIIDNVSKIIQIGTNQSSASATFTNDVRNQDQQKNSSQIKSITYTAKFECGSIVGSEGPLRPGHYDTDISIFNRQEYPINILLDIVTNGGANKTNPIIKTMQSQASTGIACKDIRQVLGIGNNNSKGLIEGFAIIRLDVNDGILNSLSSTIQGGGSTVISSSPVTINDINNFLDVNVFYTANALEFLPRDTLVKNVVFSILNDTSSKIPRGLLNKPLDITVQSELNEISDPESKVMEILSGNYGLSGDDLTGLHIRIIDLNIGVAAMIDDHAISSSVVRPQASS
jgi:hypothetical protein